MHGSALRNHSCPTRNWNLDSQRLPDVDKASPSACRYAGAECLTPTVQEIVPVAGAGDGLNWRRLSGSGTLTNLWPHEGLAEHRTKASQSCRCRSRPEQSIGRNGRP